MSTQHDMIEFLKAVRNTHWLLMLFSAATLLAGIVPARLADYWTALRDIQAIELLNDMPLSAMVSGYASEELTTTTADKETQVFVAIKPGLEDWYEQSFAMGGQQRTMSRILTAANNNEPIDFEDATLAQIRKVFHYPIYIPVPREDEYQELLNCAHVRNDRDLIRIEARFDEPLEDLPVPGGSNLKATAVLDREACYEFNYRMSNLRELLGFMFGSFSSSITKPFSTMYYIPDRPQSALGLTVQGVWEIVEHRTVSEAKRELQRLIEQKERPQPLIGFSVYRDTVIVFAPILMVICILLMGSHVLAAREAFKKGRPVNFPWIGWYQDDISRTATFISLSAVPAVSLGLMYKNAGAPWYLYVALPLFLALGGTILASLLRQLRDYCSSDSNDSEDPDAGT